MQNIITKDEHDELVIDKNKIEIGFAYEGSIITTIITFEELEIFYKKMLDLRNSD